MKIKHFRRIRELSHILSTIPSSPRKTVRGPSEIENKIPDELHLFEQKGRIEDIGNIQQTLKPADIKNISFVMYKSNEHLFCLDVLVQSEIPKFSLKMKTNLSSESFHCGIKCFINSLSTNRIHSFGRLLHIHEVLRYLNCSEIIQKRKYFNSK